MVGRKTDATRMHKKLKMLNEHLRRLRSEGGNAMLAFFVRHTRGHIQYYIVACGFGLHAGNGGRLFLALPDSDRRH